MPQCRKKKSSGEPCTLMATSKDGRSCVWHDPLRRDERKAKSAKGGRNKARPVVKEPPHDLHTLEDCQRMLRWVFTAVSRGELPKDRANTMISAVRAAATVIEKIDNVKKLRSLERQLAELKRG